MNRTAGILYPVFSLPSKYGIGCFSKEAYEFIDFLKKAGQGAWQILPVGPTGYGDSPYQSFSAFAGNPYFIDLEQLISDGLLMEDEINALNWGSDLEKVDYGAQYNNRIHLLRTAASRFYEKGERSDAAFNLFLDDSKDWLEDYCLYMAIKHENNGKSWLDWDKPLKTREKKALKEAEKRLSTDIRVYRFIQFEFMKQWNKLHAYAKENNIEIIGDMPFYVSLDSADAWSHPEVFQMDHDLMPLAVSGCAPDAFSKTGQLWGNPLYDWKMLKKNDYSWWMKRITRNEEFFDVIRIDHFQGFVSYYAIPYGEKTAEKGTTEKGPGLDFFVSMKQQLGNVKMIAEDLGTVTPELQELLKNTEIPGMKILEYAFTSWNSIYLPYKLDHDCVIYTGTHDNMPIRQWLETLNEGEMQYTRKYLNSMNTDYGALTWDFIREAYRSVADLCIIPIQDYLVKGEEARINTPGTSGNNWSWRMIPHFLSDELASSIHDLSAVYGRIPAEEK